MIIELTAAEEMLQDVACELRACQLQLAERDQLIASQSAAIKLMSEGTIVPQCLGCKRRQLALTMLAFVTGISLVVAILAETA